jgi:hypothetical protein
MSAKLIKRQYMDRGCINTRVVGRIVGLAWKILGKHLPERFAPR